mmetsp:Transcript_21958/g.70716  ORF Transcript_21958/g.70716 Transcript_21958/m.70716 type:complete len:169 (+) Transcript_21958:465-971(+)
MSSCQADRPVARVELTSFSVCHKAQSKYFHEIFFWHRVDDPERAASSLPQQKETPQEPRETTPATLEEVLSRSPTGWRSTLNPTTATSSKTFAAAGKFVREKVGGSSVSFETICSLWKADGRAGSESDLGKELTKAGVHEWVVNLKLEDGKRRTTRVRVGLRRRDETV